MNSDFKTLSMISRNESTNHIYYNIDLVNNQTIDNNLNQPHLSYQDRREYPILSDAHEYYFSIIRFQLNGIGKSIPLFVPRIMENQPDVNKTIYSVSIMINHRLQDNSVIQSIATANIQYIPQNKNISTPSTPNDYTNDYYFVHTYQHFINLVNNALDQANNACINDLINRGGTGNFPYPPRMVYNSTSGNFEIYMPEYNYNKRETKFNDLNPTYGNSCRNSLFFNSNMFNLFSNFNHNYLGGDVNNNIVFYSGDDFTQPSSMSFPGCAYEIIPTDNTYLNNNTDNTVMDTNDPPKPWYKMVMEFDNTSSIWSPVSALVFTTNLIPILPEIEGNPIEFKDINTNNTTSRNNYTKIITDMIIPLSDSSNYKQNITYYPSSEYRLSEFTKSSFNLDNISIDGYFKMRYTGELIPLRLPNQSSASFKILFKHKSIV